MGNIPNKKLHYGTKPVYSIFQSILDTVLQGNANFLGCGQKQKRQWIFWGSRRGSEKVRQGWIKIKYKNMYFLSRSKISAVKKINEKFGQSLIPGLKI